MLIFISVTSLSAVFVNLISIKYINKENDWNKLYNVMIAVIHYYYSN